MNTTNDEHTDNKNNNHITDVDTDSDDDDWLLEPLHPFDITYRPTAKRSKHSSTNATIRSTPPVIPPVTPPPPQQQQQHEHHTPHQDPPNEPNRRCKYTYRLNDDVTIQHQQGDTTTTLRCQIVAIKRNHDGTSNYHLLAEGARPNDARIILHESTMHTPDIVQPWAFVEQPTVITSKLVQSATACGVAVVPSSYGNGLQAIQDLPAGHLIPYWGKLSAIQRDGGMYNAEIAEGIYVIADDAKDRGPGTFCNDNTVHIHNGTAIRTQQRANGKLTWTIPYDTYLDDWKDYKNDGEEFAMYVELVREVKCGEDICVCYGADRYWNDEDAGRRMSNAIVVQ